MTESLRNSLVRLRPGNDVLCVSQSRTVFVTERDGFIDDGEDHGLFVHQTRLLSRYRYLIDGNPPQPVALSNVEQHSWLGYYIALPPKIELMEEDEGSGQMKAVSEQTLELRVSRLVGEGVHEDIDLTNFSRQPTTFRLEVEADADFRDQIETGGERKQHGTITRAWKSADIGVWELAFDYEAEHHYSHQGNEGVERIHRGLTLRIEHADTVPLYENGRLSFRIHLPPLGRWHTCIKLIPFIDGKFMPPLYGCHAFGGTHNEYDRRRNIFLDEATIFSTPASNTLAGVVIGALEQGKRDLAALRLYDLDVAEREWIMAAGLPIYIALFGRDVLTASWQSSTVGTEMMRGALRELALWQGDEINDWRDEQPGRMLHEAHTGPLAVLNYNPRRRYYGSNTSASFYPVAVSELWHWTGDRDLIGPLIEPALKALRWLDEYGDIDGDGFSEYKTRSEQGVKHQGWKDSPDAIVYEDGRQVEPPLGTCEEQAFKYGAKFRMSEVLWWMGDRDEALRLYREAAELKKRFNETFWMEDEGFFAMGLDCENRQIKSIGSNPGHCLAAAIVDESLVEKTADRLMKEDLFTGWGIRTLSSRHPAFNPYSYHRGSVWPVEQGTFALGFARYGLYEHLEKICRAQFEAAALFDFLRLPELFSGHQRDREHPFPAFYPQANSPQAWSASTVFCLLQAMLSLYPYAPLNMLLVDPRLPEWLPEITLRNLRVGDAVTTIRFYRKEEGTSDYEILDKRGSLHVLRQPSPWSLTASFAERARDALASLLPGR